MRGYVVRGARRGACVGGKVDVGRGTAAAETLVRLTGALCTAQMAWLAYAGGVDEKPIEADTAERVRAARPAV